MKTTTVEIDGILNDIDDANVKEELQSSEHFLVDSEYEQARHTVFNYAIENLNAKIVDEKHDHIFNNLKCAAKVILTVQLILKNREDGGFRQVYIHENDTLLDPSKYVCTKDI